MIHLSNWFIILFILVAIDSLKSKNNVPKNVKHKIINGESLIGGGTLPNITLSSPVMVLDVDRSEKVLMKLINNEYPIIPRVADGKINIDLRSVFKDQDDEIAKFINSLWPY